MNAAPKPLRSHLVRCGPFGTTEPHRWEGPISFRVTGEPRPEPRPRARAIYNKVLRKWMGTVYPSDEADQWKAAVKYGGYSTRPRAPLIGPVAVAIHIIETPPDYVRGWTGERMMRWVKPDSDNYAKAILDAMTQDHWWHDDGQVAWLLVTKWHAAEGELPGAFIEVYHLEQPGKQGTLLAVNEGAAPTAAVSATAHAG